ncbi:MAG: hypothetical protein ABJA79_07015 [Parafilimonas sp.]
MYLLRYIYAACIVITASCSNDSGKYPKAENALDAAREFISASLKGDFQKASFYMLKDEENQHRLNLIEKDYRSKSNSQKQEYFDASIIINEDATLNDSIHIINYQNSYDNIARKVKVINRNNTWLVDFKYTFNGNL